MAKVIKWEVYPNFHPDEFRCSHTDEVHMDTRFMEPFQELRTLCDFPFHINSGYRAPSHPIEAAKAKPGEHSMGLCADVGIYGERAFVLIAKALDDPRFTRIGVKQIGPNSGRFIHIGVGQSVDGLPAPRVWSYPYP